MLLRHIQSGPSLARACLHCSSRRFAREVRSFAGSAQVAEGSEESKSRPISTLDTQVLQEVQSRGSSPDHPLNSVFKQYSTKANSVLNSTLPYESSPSSSRRVSFELDAASGVGLLTHAAVAGDEHKITFCSGFAIQTDDASSFISCAHTLEEMHRSRLFLEPNALTATLVFTQPDKHSAITAHPVLNLLSSLPRSDLVLLSTSRSFSHTLPISPYPAPVGTPIRAHFVSETRPADDSGWSPWIHGTWRKWTQGKVLGYRDFAGREAEPGTYDSLNHIYFNPPPPAGSSGGPIVDEKSGAVIGIILGSRMDNHIEGMRGWGVPSEVIYEMFRLPGDDMK